MDENRRFAVLRACLKMGNSPSTVLLAAACVGSASTARCGDALTDPPWQPPKLQAAGPFRIFRQALRFQCEEVPLHVIVDLPSNTARLTFYVHHHSPERVRR